MLGCITVVNDNIIDNATVTRESSKGFVHPAVVMLGDGRDSIRSAKVLESPCLVELAPLLVRLGRTCGL